MLWSQHKQQLHLSVSGHIIPSHISRPVESSHLRSLGYFKRSDVHKVKGASGNVSTAAELANELVCLTDGKKWGVNLSATDLERVQHLVAEIQSLSSAGHSNNKDLQGKLSTASSAKVADKQGSSCVDPLHVTAAETWKLGGKWNLLFTTEGSVRALVKSLLFGMSVQGISQSIDLRNLRVTNRIEFASFGFTIQAGAPFQIIGRNKISYSFDEVIIEFSGLWRLSVPLRSKRGGGRWTEAIFVDDELRVMRNSLGDTLLFRNVREHA
ncbi:hypothetical protein CEUSTIGMA_g1861.t1 [Chlamydomonas eustigma]|uniref:Plastid lipid-associated protein/fibrillin conserved domain-containing protein n=1 Tax=Chlamydomonas eustigma TaxID=1157962 RepID=A0A250WUB6_9CHLO|nr:hypothetical protein CEUSTIGMA_g1861.t1 [Chlamydomonas eustigma]|eukprot:GAX74413.1 hypothetical protein CEUSTIGMA_g1861.t1 [Chlamydomonas eustigma]